MQLFHREYGQGQPLIILHGLFGLSDNWVAIAKRIANFGFQVYVLDQRNHGQSPHSETFNYAALVDDLRTFIIQQNLSDVILLGHSMGGKVAMKFAIENPVFTSKLIIVDIALRSYALSESNKSILDVMRGIDLSTFNSRKEVMAILEAKIPSERVRMLALKNIQRTAENKLQWRINIDSIFKNLKDLSGAIGLDTSYDKTVLFIKGGNSDYINDTDIDDIKRVFKNNSISTIKGASHWVHADAPVMFLEKIKKFVC
ncbi:MAG: alpha/beta fold hydrolase [Bacteroidales bacterium]|nr:alpha/beta fold hydrolase [Bacteroidales bacterium]